MYIDIGSIQKIGMDIGSIQTLDEQESLSASGNLFICGHSYYHSLYIPSVAPITFGNETEFLSADEATYISAAALSTTKFVVAYKDRDDSSHGTVKIGTVSGTTITFGDEAEFLSADDANEISIAAFSETKFVVVYADADDSYHGTAKIGTVSGTTVTFGEETEFRSDGQAWQMSVDIFNSSKFVVVYADSTDNDHGTAKIGTVSGTTITFGDEAEFLSSGAICYPFVSSLSETKFIVVYTDEADDNHGTAKIGTVSGTTITFGEETEFVSAGGSSWNSATALDTSKFVVAYLDGFDSNHGTAKIGTINGTTITFGAEAEFLSDGMASWNFVTALDPSRFVVAYVDDSDSNHGTAKIGTVSGTTITFSEETEFESGAVNYISATALDSLKFVVAYRDISDSNHGTAKVGGLPTEYIPPGDLFIRGHESKNNNVPLYIDGIRVTCKIYACGDNTNRPFGVAAEVNRVTSLQRAFGTLFIKYPYTNYPTCWENDGDRAVAHRCPTTAACAPTQGACVDEDGNVWSVGTNTNYALGIGNTNESYVTSLPVRVSGLPDIPFIGVRIGDKINFAIAENGTVWGWGHNGHGELGIGNTINQETAQQVSGIINTIDIDVNSHHSVFVTNSGVFACGEYDDGKLGISGVAADVLIPHKVSGLNDITIVDVACGNDTTMFLSSSGDIYFCGKNNHGLFGDGTVKNDVRSTPTLSVSGDSYHCPLDITCDTNSSAFLCGSGHVYCAGYNRRGKFGNGATGGDYINFTQVTQDIPSGVNIRMGDEASWLSCRDSASGVWAAGGSNDGEVGSTEDIPWTSWQQVPGSSGYLRMWGTEKQLVIYQAVVERILYINETTNLYIAGPLLSPASGDLFIHGYTDYVGSGSLFLDGHETIQASGDLYVNGYETISISGNLFIHGPELLSTSMNLFVEGSVETSGWAPSLFIRGYNSIFASGNLYIEGHESLAMSGDLFIGGYADSVSSGDLFVHGHIDDTSSGNLFMHGHIECSASGGLFTEGHIDSSGVPAPSLFAHGHEPYSGSMNLFMNGIEPLGRPIDWLLKSSDHYPQIIGILEGATSVNIQVWEVTDGQNTPISVTSNVCYQIGDTGRWGWSTSNLPTDSIYQHQYFYVMRTNHNHTFTGQFFLQIPEKAKWIHPRNMNEYLK